MRNFLFFVFLVFSVGLYSCKKDEKIAVKGPPVVSPDEDDNEQEPGDTPGEEDGEIVLQVKTGWVTDTLFSGCIRYTLSGYYAPANSSQNVNVLEVDITRPEYDLVFKGGMRDSISKVGASVFNSIAAINGTYGEAIDGGRVSFYKGDGKIVYEVTIPSSHLRFWKHEGAFYYNSADRKTGIEYGTNAIYKSWPYPDIISGSPVLIDNHIPVGETFVDPNVNLSNLPGEDKNKHQGVRHPRTAIAITESNKILLFTVDGRRGQTAGMTAKELTQFIKRNFNPRYALNLDGGGSTTMWIKGSNVSSTGVVNYPTDNDNYDHYGQRLLNTSIVVTRNKK